MKWAVAAAVASATAAAVASGAELLACGRASSFAGRRHGLLFSEEGSSRVKRAEEKFAPRFDGLRFIETLVTAHR